MACLDIRNDSGADAPPDEQLGAAVEAALVIAGKQDADAEISLCIVECATMRELNHRYRDRDYATNVLSFPAELPPGVPFTHLGDIVICAAVVAEEAKTQGKPVAAHWAHMLVHGTLHLVGFDHIEDTEAQHMEALETAALAGLGWPRPYGDSPSAHPEPTAETPL